MFSRRGLSRVEDDKLHASFRPFGSSRHGGALVKTVPAGHVISAWPKSEELSAWIFWGTGEFENGARSYIFITLKRLREYGMREATQICAETRNLQLIGLDIPYSLSLLRVGTCESWPGHFLGVRAARRCIF